MNAKFRKFGLAALLAAVILVTVGVMVWPTPEEAKAVNFYEILCVEVNEEDQVIGVIEGLWVEITIQGELTQQGQTDLAGSFSCQRDDALPWVANWVGQMNQGWVLVWPNTPLSVSGPATIEFRCLRL